MYFSEIVPREQPVAVSAGPARRAGTQQRFLVLDSLRGICACMIVIFHFHTLSPIAGLPLVHNSWLFVDFFFVLSGFVIVSNYHAKLNDGLSASTFLLLRLARVYPLHVVMLVAFVAMECLGALASSTGLMHRAAFDPSHSAAAIATNLYFVQIFGIEGRGTWNIPAWSIAAEFWTYVLFAATATATFRRPALSFGIAALVSAALLLSVAGNINVTFAWSLARCVLGFSVGALAWLAWQRVSANPPALRWNWTAAEFVAIAATVVFMVAAGTTALSVAGPVVFGGVVLVFARGGGAVSRLLGLRFPLFLGTISYSIYMVHSFVQARFEDLMQIVGHVAGVPLTAQGLSPAGTPVALVGATPLQGTVLTVIMLAIVIAVAAVSWRVIEQPMQKWGRAYAAHRPSRSRRDAPGRVRGELAA